MASKTDIIESLLFASDKPVTLKKLAQIVELTTEETMAELDALRVEKESIGSIQLIEVAGGWQLATKSQFSAYIRQLRDAPRQRLSRAAFEVLAVVAYRQPVTRSEIEALRGVDCSGPVQFLLEKKLLEFAGRKDAPGRPHLYGTTAEFLDHFGLRDLTDLPTLEELAELNGGALALGEIHDGDRLFNRGAMKSEEDAEAEAEEAAEVAAAQAAAQAAAAAEASAAEGDVGAAETAELTAENTAAEDTIVDGESPVENEPVEGGSETASEALTGAPETTEAEPASEREAAVESTTVDDTAEAVSVEPDAAEPVAVEQAEAASFEVALIGESSGAESPDEAADETDALTIEMQVAEDLAVPDEETEGRVVLPPDMWFEDDKVVA